VSSLYRSLLLAPVAVATRRDAEVAMDLHLRAMRALQANGRVLDTLRRRHPAGSELQQELLDGLRFPHPFGVAAGYDKNAAVYPAFEAHFSPGFVEVGTVTLRPQGGNVRPRIHRLPGGHLVNAMGFPNAGSDALVANLQTLPAPTVPLGVNVGKLKATPDGEAPAEYADVVRRLRAWGSGRLTTSSSTSPRRTPRACGLCRRWAGWRRSSTPSPPSSTPTPASRRGPAGGSWSSSRRS
jgi:dihydroorotate dehydrogenase